MSLAGRGEHTLANMPSAIRRRRIEFNYSFHRTAYCSW